MNMRKVFCFLVALSALCSHAGAQNAVLEYRLDSVVVSASRAGKETPVTYTEVSRDELRSADPLNSLPMSLNLLPSVVTYNEGGTGLGNSAMTIRGSKGSQINVTLNGITLNDAETQEVFWVNIPALGSLISNVQVQRGLGTSASGAGAFGASINMNTAMSELQPSFRWELSGGSYGTFITTVAGSSGVQPNGLYFNLMYSTGYTDGYIRNAKVASSSLLGIVGWRKGQNSLRFTYLMGQQTSGITWDGIDLETYATDRRYNGAGYMYTDDAGIEHYYDNQTDNYQQQHLQLNYTRGFAGGLTWTNTLNYTRGDGFDEYYKTRRKFVNYGFTDLPEDIPARSDMIYRKTMDNDLWVADSRLSWKSGALDVTGGVNLSYYDGGHWGTPLWAKELPSDYAYDKVDWYRYDGLKKEWSTYLRAEYQPFPFLTGYLDLQYRAIRYTLQGCDDDWVEMGSAPEDRLDFSASWPFFNPRAGLTFHSGPHKAYLSAAIGHREPGRSDIKENVKGEGSPIAPEKMLDVELGYVLSAKTLSLSANLYLMEYWDMLLETGRLSSSGYPVKENVPRAWRRGVELAAGWSPVRWLRLDGNATLSVNEIQDYTSFVAYDDDSGRTKAVSYGKTQMLLSPQVIGMARATFLVGGASLSMDGKYVGKQFIDNTMREELAIPAYFVSSLSLSYPFRWGGSTLTLSAYVGNVFNHLYYASGWRWEAYSEADDAVYCGIGVYPQAPRHFSLKAVYAF